MMYETEANSGEYQVSSDTTWPQDGYIFNEQLSGCENGGTLLWNSETKRVVMQTTSSDKCYVYFDKEEEINKAQKTLLQLGLTISNETPDFSKTSCSSGCEENTVGIFEAEDDLGTSYYFRGDVTNNYVKFANYFWRIIRINGDGTIRMIYDGTSAHRNGEDSIDRHASVYSTYNDYEIDNAYVGYMYGNIDTYVDGGRSANVSNIFMSSSLNYYYGTSYTFDSTVGGYKLTGTLERGIWNTERVGKYTCTNLRSDGVCTTLYYIASYVDSTHASVYTYDRVSRNTSDYESTHENLHDSNIKKATDNWYQSNIASNANYSDLVADAIYCNDRSINTGLGYGSNNTTYGAYGRLINDNALPSLKCQNVNDRFAVQDNINNVSTNGDLNYPVGLITADEMIYAGARWSANNSNYYLYTSNAFYTMTPYYYVINSAWVFGDLDYQNIYDAFLYGNYRIRPVISLKASLEVEGDGSASNPFVFLG